MGKRKFENKGEDKPPKQKKLNEVQEENVNSELDQTSKDDDTGHEFNVKHFRKELSAKQGQTIALTQFLQVCTNPDMKHDYMLDYLKSGGNSHEILRQVSNENKKNLTLTTPTFHLFHLIILKVQSSVPHMIAITEEACRYFLNTFMPTVEIMISEHSGPRHRKIILKLLTSMVTLNPDLGVEILNQAPLTPKHLQYIVEKPNYKEKDNVRTTFVHFITSFLVDGHLPLIKALLEKQGLLSLVIPGLTQDEAEAVLMFLNLLKTNIIENTSISKSLKLKTFSHIVLHNLFKVYNWKGPPEYDHSTKTEMQPAITSLLSQIILTLFTSHKQGLYFIDKSLGTSDVHKNQNLYKALLLLKRPWENKRQSQVIVNIVDKCPDLHRALISVIEQSFEPQNTPVWFNSTSFVSELLQRIQPDEVMERMKELSPTQTTNFIRFTTLPIPLLKFLKQGINKEDLVITTECLKVISAMLETLKKYLYYMDICEPSIAELLKTRLEGFFPKHLPSPDTLVNLIHHIMKDDQSSKSAKESNLMQESNALIEIFNVLILYSEIYPPYLEGIEGLLDMQNVLNFTESLASERIILLRFKIVTLWLTLDPSAISLKKPMFSKLLLIMLEVYTDENEDVSMLSRSTLRNFFKTTLIFDNCEGEIDVVLQTLKNAKVEPTSILVEIMQQTLSNIDELKQALHGHIENVRLPESTEDSNFRKILDNLSNNVKSVEYNMLIDAKTPSPFILGCLKVLKANKNYKNYLKKFISLLSVNLVHYYNSPELLLNILDTLKCEAKTYIGGWIGEPIILEADLAQGDDVMVKMSRYVLEENIHLHDVFPYFDIVEEENADTTVEQLHIKWKSNIVVNNAELLVWSHQLSFYIIQLTKISALCEKHVEKILRCLNIIIAICKKYKHNDTCRQILYDIFTNSQTLSLFYPVENVKRTNHNLCTKYLINIIDQHREDLLKLHTKFKIMKPYQQKTFVEIKKVLKKNCKGTLNIDNQLTIKTLEVVGMSNPDTIEILNIIADMDPKCTVTENKECSIVLKILCFILTDASLKAEDLPSETVSNIFTLYTNVLKDSEINTTLTDLETVLKNYFEQKPKQVKLINKEIFRNFFSSKVIRKTTSLLAAAILKYNVVLCEIFKEEILNPEIICQRELALPLGEAVINHGLFIEKNMNLLEQIYKEYKLSVIKVLEKPHKVGQIYSANWRFVRLLIYECMPLEDCMKFFDKVHKFEIVELFHVQLMQAMFMKMCVGCEVLKKEYLINYFSMMISLLSVALKVSADYSILKDIVENITNVAQISKGIRSFDTQNKDNFKKLIENAVWQNFCKAALKDSLKVKTQDSDQCIGTRLLSMLSTLVKLFYPFNHEDIASLFDMVTSHSEFLNVMLSHHSTDVKSRLIELLYILILRNKSVMKSQQIPVYLSAYHATRNPGDRLILTILHFYETNGQAIHEYKPYVWGDSGANYYAVRKNRTSSLWGHPTPNHIINLFDKETIDKTIKYFPVNQKLDYKYELPSIEDAENHNNSSVSVLLQRMQRTFTNSKKVDVSTSVERLLLRNRYDRSINKMKEVEFTSLAHSENEEMEGIYDPSFVLPLLSQVLAPGSVVSCFKLVRSGLLGLPVMALSSLCPGMRAAGYHVLHRFCQQLETETKHRNDKLLMTDFIDILRHSLTTAIITAQKEKDAIKDQKNPRLPAIAALYLAKSLSIATAPFDPLYKPINNFLIAKQQIDLTVVPDFLSLFHDREVESKERRLWILSVMTDGLKTMSEVNLVFKTMALKMIMDFYSTVLADKKTKEAILVFLNALVSIPRAAEILIEGYGFISWLNCAIRELNENRGLASLILQILENLKMSLSVNSFAKLLNDLRRSKEPKDKEARRREKDVYVDVNNLGELKINRDVDQQLKVLKECLSRVEM